MRLHCGEGRGQARVTVRVGGWGWKGMAPGACHVCMRVHVETLLSLWLFHKKYTWALGMELILFSWLLCNFKHKLSTYAISLLVTYQGTKLNLQTKLILAPKSLPSHKMQNSFFYTCIHSKIFYILLIMLLQLSQFFPFCLPPPSTPHPTGNHPTIFHVHGS